MLLRIAMMAGFAGLLCAQSHLPATAPAPTPYVPRLPSYIKLTTPELNPATATATARRAPQLPLSAAAIGPLGLPEVRVVLCDLFGGYPAVVLQGGATRLEWGTARPPAGPR